VRSLLRACKGSSATAVQDHELPFWRRNRKAVPANPSCRAYAVAMILRAFRTRRGGSLDIGNQMFTVTEWLPYGARHVRRSFGP
jgi:hypothetical protein